VISFCFAFGEHSHGTCLQFRVNGCEGRAKEIEMQVVWSDPNEQHSNAGIRFVWFCEVSFGFVRFRLVLLGYVLLGYRKLTGCHLLVYNFDIECLRVSG